MNSKTISPTPAIASSFSEEIVTAITPEPVNQIADEELIAQLSSLKPMEYDRVRKEAAKTLGIQVKTLDEMIKASRNEGCETDRMPFSEIEPHDSPVILADVLNEVAETIRRYVILDREQADAAALWIAHTHLTEVFEISPLLIINAPERACAKTLLQTLVGRMSHRPLPASNASLSAIFRAVELWGPTILIDEADTFFRDHSELHGMVNAGYKRGGYVLRSESVGDSFEPRMFSVYSAKSIAGIALERHLPDSTMSRGIVINMRRKLSHENVMRMRHASDSDFEQIASKLVRFANDQSQQVRLTRPNLPDELSDRAQDNWECLLAIAERAGVEWRERATHAALKLSAASEQSSGTSNELLAGIREIFKKWPGTKISTVDLINALINDDEKSWATYNRGKPISPRQLAKQLSIYGIKSKTVRLGPEETPKGYELDEFNDAFLRYLKPLPILAPQGNCATSPTEGLIQSALIADLED